MIGSLFGIFTATSLGKMLPSWAWELIFIGLLAGGIVLFHHVEVVKHDNKVRTEQSQKDNAAFQKQLEAVRVHALQVRDKVEKLDAQASQLAKEAHDAKIGSVSNDVADIVRGGAGKASCGYIHYPAPAASPGGPQHQSGTGGSSAPQVLDSGGAELVALPLNDAARLFGQCDINRDEAAKWRGLWDSLVKGWPVH